ncbi:nucleotidyl transferase AbiEii/AbiGii toxin family protein [Spiribacter onubensis]|uniref:Nucleotidyl transferase AbiEii/AbiGii toxin family protein n=1 Tax=Spiribacter onubensis TaxID=3122420 RepID=A0ABV3SD50_9GAMM
MIELLQQKLARYTIAGADEQEQALKEILQELTLYALWREGFFHVAAFQGGTCLRILYGLPRFSEDLDFILQTPDPDFSWARTVEGVAAVLAEFGVVAELTDRTRADRAVRQAMLKDNSLGGQLDLKFTDLPPGRKLRIKLEVDTNPPSGSAWSQRFHDFPTDFSVAVQDLPSNFALKLHALLCRPYTKGRDWYDLLWYIRNGTLPNMHLLQNALDQTKAVAGSDTEISPEWLRQALIAKIQSLDWAEAIRDVEPFLNGMERRSLAVWGEPLFTERVQQLSDQLKITQ